MIWCFDVTDTLLHAHTYGNVDIDSGWHSVALNPACTYKRNEAIRSPNLHIVPKGLSGWRHRRRISAGGMRAAVTEAFLARFGNSPSSFLFFLLFFIYNTLCYLLNLLQYHSLSIHCPTYPCSSSPPRFFFSVPPPQRCRHQVLHLQTC